MAKSAPAQTSFTGGEFDPLVAARKDLGRYKEALAICQNYTPILQGPAVKRPGSNFVAEVKTSSKKTRLIRFEFSTTQAYIIEFGDLYVRFYRNRGQILNGGSPVEVTTTYTEAELFQLKFTQSADVLYIAHPAHKTAKLTRTAHITWTLTDTDFTDGPYLLTNTSAVTMTPSAVTGTGITITASAATFVDATKEVGRLIRLETSSTWGYAKITAFTSTTVVVADVKSDFGGIGATDSWRLGAFYTANFPAAVTLHENRLGVAGAPDSPQRWDLSASNDFENFAPTATDGTVSDDNAISYSLDADNVNAIRWMLSIEKGLAMGTVGGEWLVTPSSDGQALTPSNVGAKRTGTYGSADIAPVQIGGAVLYVHRALRKLREMTFVLNTDGFQSFDLTLLASHITQSGLTEIAFQREPYNVLWSVRDDGVLLSTTYERDSEALRVGWARHIIGGVSDAAGTAAKVESIDVIPNTDLDSEDLWMVVNRRINGVTKRFVEWIGDYFKDDTDQEDAFFVDSGLTLDDPKAITGATAASPVVITSTAHGFSDADIIIIRKVAGMTQLNDETFKVANKTANTYELTNEVDDSNVDGTGFTSYISGGEANKFVTTISGLTHLEGESLDILGDGAVQPNKTVSSGSITLATRASIVHAGLHYNSDLQMLRLDSGSATGTAFGKTQRTHRVGIQLYRSLGLKIGVSFDKLAVITFRLGSDKMSRPVALFTGILSRRLEGDYSFDNQIALRSDQPLPSFILGIYPQLDTQDRQ